MEGPIYPAGLKLWSSIVKRRKFWLTAPFQAECDPQSVSWVSQGSGRRSKRGVREEEEMRRRRRRKRGGKVEEERRKRRRCMGEVFGVHCAAVCLHPDAAVSG